MQTTFARVLSALALAPLALAMSVPAKDMPMPMPVDMLKRDGCSGQLVTGHLKLPVNDGTGDYAYLSFGCAGDLATCTPSLVALSAARATSAVIFQSCIDANNALTEIRTAPANSSDTNSLDHYWPNTFWLAGLDSTTLGVSASSQTTASVRTNVFRTLNNEPNFMFQWDNTSPLLFPTDGYDWTTMKSVSTLGVAQLGTFVIEPLY